MSDLKHLLIRIRAIALLVLIGLMARAVPVWAQEGEVRLSVSKTWGFALGSQVQGLFTLSVKGAQDIESVTFELDGSEIATVTQPPFTLRFNTDKYPRGWHALSATVRTSGGRTLKSNTVTVEFVSTEQGWQVTQRIMVPLLSLVILIVVISTVGQFLLSDRDKHRLKPGVPRSYGIAGGAICPRCGRPFALSLLSLNLVTRKLARCPYCGGWSAVRRASPEALAAAEAAEAAASGPAIPELDSAEKLCRLIEESRYE